MNDMHNRGSGLAKTSLIFALLALIVPIVVVAGMMVAMASHPKSTLSQVLMGLVLPVAYIFAPACGVVAATCGHLARRRLDINPFPQKDRLAVAGMSIGYAVVFQSLAGQLVQRVLLPLLSGGM